MMTPSTPAPATVQESPSQQINVVVPPEVQALFGELDPAAAAPEASTPPPAPPAAPDTAPAPTPAATPIPAAAQLAAPPLDPRIASRARAGEQIWGRIEQDLEAGRDRALALDMPGGWSKADWDRFIAETRQEVMRDLQGVEEPEKIGATIVDRVFGRLQTYDEARRKDEGDFRWKFWIQTLEQDARDRYGDFDETLAEAGLWDQILPDAQGRVRNPALYREIYGRSNPPDSGYWTAIARLAHKAGLSPEAYFQQRQARRLGATQPSPAVPAPTAAPALRIPTPSTPASAQPTAAEAARAAEAATVETLDRMADNSRRPRGLRDLAPAGEPTQVMSRGRLDQLMAGNFEAYKRLIDANPGLEEWHMVGSDFGP